MATRIYLPSSGAALVTPSTWNFANQINPVTLRGVTTRISSAMTTKTEATGTTSPTARAMGRHVIGPLAAQTISGTVKGQFRCSENNAGANATISIAVKIVQPGGADRGVLLAQTAADTTTTPPEMATSLTNRRVQNSAESAAPSLTPQDATAGDYLVIEWGFRSATTTTRNISISYGDDNATDLPENDTETLADNPWVEFSGTIVFLASGSGAVATAPVTSSGSATFTGPGVTGIGAVTVGAATASGSGASGYHPVGVITQPKFGLWGRRYGSFAGKGGGTFTGSGTVTVGAATANGSATFTIPAYSGIGAVTVGSVSASGSGTFVAPTYSGVGAATVGAATASGTGVFAAEVYSGVGDSTVGAATASGTGTFATPTYSGVGTATVVATTASGAGTFTVPSYSGIGSVTTGVAAASGTGTFTSQVFTGSGAVTVGAAAASGTGIFSEDFYTGVGAVTAGAAGAAGSGGFTPPPAAPFVLIGNRPTNYFPSPGPAGSFQPTPPPPPPTTVSTANFPSPGVAAPRTGRGRR